MRISNGFLGVIGAVALSGCCNGPVAYVDCAASGIDVSIVDDLGEPAFADTVTWRLNSRNLRYAECVGATEDDENEPCDRFSIPYRGQGTYTIETWAGGQLVNTEVVEAFIPEAKASECCGDVFYEDVTIEVPTES